VASLSVTPVVKASITRQVDDSDEVRRVDLMGVYGHLFCKTCKEQIFLGKWLREDGLGFGFWHGMLCRDAGADSLALGRKALRFIARHLNHEVIAGSDTGGLSEELFEEGYLCVDEEYDAIAVLDEVPASFLDPPPARLPGISDATQWRHAKFRRGDRVVMLRHAGWKNDVTGTVAEEGQPRELDDGSIDLEYSITIDEAQRDQAEEWNRVDAGHDEAYALERFLRPLDAPKHDGESESS
jgi:hypothetical protein